MKKVFVTGINGLLGANLIESLLSNGFFVKGLIRDKAKFKGKNHANLQIHQGNLFNDLTPLLSDIDFVIHIAAETSQDLIQYTDYQKINYNATVQLFNAAVYCNVKKFVFVSTANTLGYGSLNDLGNEQKEIKLPFTNSFYAKSKLEAEEYLLQNKDKIEVLIINPTFMIGAYDSKPSSGKIILMGWKKKIIFYPAGGKNFVHVKDVSSGIIKSLEKGKNGEKYLLANKNLSYLEFFTKLNFITDQNPIMIRIPRPILIASGYLGDFIRLFKIKTSISSTNMKALCINNFYSNEKSINELEIKYQHTEVAINDAVKYFEKKKMEHR
ncbi:NAD-dependent epimerase/dehydratase family protein [Flavobacterium sp. LS1R49]|uniref:NAD-dependent epimerase/dehydratase family protein n=1 Tax=Flavobacterium shii TaxID=2987687 RepID=A0A9X2YVS9_9FLAO|nr:NAD-dependent epimerase/dehydratase family protein [Flavobacterium shii]MCV9928564.1 NAD-dependent epimerase/dehydratase family protein [Flavobacterium shii]